MKKVEAEGGELVLRSNNGAYAIIPKALGGKVQRMLEQEDYEGIDQLVNTLPLEEDYAEDGTLIVPTKKAKSVSSSSKKGKDPTEMLEMGMDENTILNSRLSEFITSKDMDDKHIETKRKLLANYSGYKKLKDDVEDQIKGLKLDPNLENNLLNLSASNYNRVLQEESSLYTDIFHNTPKSTIAKLPEIDKFKIKQYSQLADEYSNSTMGYTKDQLEMHKRLMPDVEGATEHTKMVYNRDNEFMKSSGPYKGEETMFEIKSGKDAVKTPGRKVRISEFQADPEKYRFMIGDDDFNFYQNKINSKAQGGYVKAEDGLVIPPDGGKGKTTVPVTKDKFRVLAEQEAYQTTGTYKVSDDEYKMVKERYINLYPEATDEDLDKLVRRETDKATVIWPMRKNTSEKLSEFENKDFSDIVTKASEHYKKSHGKSNEEFYNVKSDVGGFKNTPLHKDIYKRIVTAADKLGMDRNTALGLALVESNFGKGYRDKGIGTIDESVLFSNYDGGAWEDGEPSVEQFFAKKGIDENTATKEELQKAAYEYQTKLGKMKPKASTGTEAALAYYKKNPHGYNSGNKNYAKIVETAANAFRADQENLDKWAKGIK